MRFWDSSALVPLLVEEDTTKRLQALYQPDVGLLVWWGSIVECASAISRLERETNLTTRQASRSLNRLEAMTTTWNEVAPSERVRRAATRLLRVHSLRAADALQLAAAFVASEERPRTLQVVCLDERLALAAQREGFEVIDGSDGSDFDSTEEG